MTTVHSSGTSLVARTVEAEPSRDPLDGFDGHGFAWIGEGIAFVARGVAARCRADEAEDLLAGVAVEDGIARPGTGAIAVGALPFLDASSATVVVPARVDGLDPDGRAWRTDIAPFDARSVAPAAPGAAAPGACALHDAWSRDGWHTAVRDALGRIDAGDLEKVVLARAVDAVGAAPFDLARVVAALRAQQPGCFVFAAPGIVGASPELLVRRRGHRVISRPLAGTGSTGAERALAASEKDGREHALVVDAVADVFADWCEGRPVVQGPHVVGLADVTHLASTVDGRLAPGAPGALALALALHPTPAVAGTPSDAALEAIFALEPVSRGLYAGPVGWVDDRGDGEVAVALRCAQVEGNRARLHAGAGIVAGSDADAEWDETAAKLQPMLRALQS